MYPSIGYKQIARASLVNLHAADSASAGLGLLNVGVCEIIYKEHNSSPCPPFALQDLGLPLLPQCVGPLCILSKGNIIYITYLKRAREMGIFFESQVIFRERDKH